MKKYLLMHSSLTKWNSNPIHNEGNFKPSGVSKSDSVKFVWTSEVKQFVGVCRGGGSSPFTLQ